MSASSNAESLVFAYQLAHQSPDFRAAEWTARLESAAARSTARTTASSWNAGLSGMLELDLGHTPEGRALLESALLLPDYNLAHHFAREALRGVAGKP
jgi:hypothetical protein